MGAAFDNEISLDEQRIYDTPQTQGVYVIQITAGSPAEKAGLVAADPQTGKGGDLIIAVDGQPVQTFAELNSYLVFHTSPDQSIQLTVLRGSQKMDISLTLAETPLKIFRYERQVSPLSVQDQPEFSYSPELDEQNQKHFFVCFV